MAVLNPQSSTNFAPSTFFNIHASPTHFGDMASQTLSPIAALNFHDLELDEMAPGPHSWGTTHRSDDQEELIHKRNISSTSSISFAASPNFTPSVPPLGSPTAKKMLHLRDLSAAALSFVCLAIAIATVVHGDLSWRLGVRNNQLIVLGFLLSAMNLCLGSVFPILFLHLEARFGSSRIQNYDGILRNQPFTPRLSVGWRIILCFLLALPLGLSAAYKQFSGGESGKFVNPAKYIGNSSYYGMFVPPGLQSLNEMSGISLFSNATLPFLVASSSINNTEPPVPAHEKAYGFNVLLLDTERTAMLDIPQPD